MDLWLKNYPFSWFREFTPPLKKNTRFSRENGPEYGIRSVGGGGWRYLNEWGFMAKSPRTLLFVAISFGSEPSLVAEITRVGGVATHGLKCSELSYHHHKLQQIDTIRHESSWVRCNSFLFVAIHWIVYPIIVIRHRSFIAIRYSSVAHQTHSFWSVLRGCTSPTALYMYDVGCYCNWLCFILQRDNSTWWLYCFPAKIAFVNHCNSYQFAGKNRPTQAIFSAFIRYHRDEALYVALNNFREQVQRQGVLNSLIIHHLNMITWIGYGNILPHYITFPTAWKR